MTEPTVHVRPTRYEVCALPAGDINADLYTVTITLDRRGTWAVEHGGYCLGGDEIHERKATCFLRHRYDLDTAWAIGLKAAPEITVMGRTVADALARSQEADPT